MAPSGTTRIADQIGRVLGGRYRLLAPIGTGASAHVYVADDVELHRRVAVKVLHPALAEDEAFLRRFRAEARAVANLRHPHVMQVFDWGQDADGPFLVLEHLSGGSLRDVLDRGHLLSPSQALAVGLEAARGLDYAHRRGLVHRDIKPANLLFDDEGRLSIADFGLARALAEAAWTEPAGAVLGTARYASPEQARGSSVDGKSDVYALALTLIESVTGRVPFAADTTIATLMGRIDRPLEVSSALGPLVEALTAAGATDPGARIDAGELARRLEAAATELPRPAPLPLTEAVPPTPIALRVPDDVTVIGRVHDVEDQAPPVVDDPAVRRRRWWPKVLAALVVVAALIGGGLALAAATKPTYVVPELSGKTLPDARRLVSGKQDFEVVKGSSAFSETVDRGLILDQSPLPKDELKEGGTIRVRVSAGPEPRQLPDLSGKTRGEVQTILDGLRLVLAPRSEFSDAVPKDVVVDWTPRNARIPREGTVTVTFSGGKEPKPVPSLVDKLYDEAVKILQGLGFGAGKEEAFSDKVKAGSVITTKPEPGSPTEPGSQVVLVVSKGPEQVEVPQLNGLSEDEAQSRLESVGLRLGDRFGPPKRRVFASLPRAGAKVDKGSSVDIYLG
ncbi:MAG TPA: PASTA domain-containing protein [Acidimicrobiales bacterium]|nr:PASTA domain-containing protein [Acidimicrobiales bacterium]